MHTARLLDRNSGVLFLCMAHHLWCLYHTVVCPALPLLHYLSLVHLDGLHHVSLYSAPGDCGLPWAAASAQGGYSLPGVAACCLGWQRVALHAANLLHLLLAVPHLPPLKQLGVDRS